MEKIATHTTETNWNWWSRTICPYNCSDTDFLSNICQHKYEKYIGYAIHNAQYLNEIHVDCSICNILLIVYGMHKRLAYSGCWNWIFSSLTHVILFVFLHFDKNETESIAVNAFIWITQALSLSTLLGINIRSKPTQKQHIMSWWQIRSLIIRTSFKKYTRKVVRFQIVFI